MEKQIFKIVGYAIGAIVFYYLLVALLPYIELFLAFCGAWYIWQEYQKDNRRH